MGMITEHEYNDSGRHRIVKYNNEQEGQRKEGAWAAYDSPAILVHMGLRYVAVTDYYTGSAEFPDCNKFYIIQDSVLPYTSNCVGKL